MKQETSKRITVLRVILIVLVIFIHNNNSNVENTLTAYCIKTAISEMIARVAVPIFFLISGYLLFMKNEPYLTVLKKKAKTILLPYVLWNMVVLAMFFIGQNMPYISRFFNDENNMIANYSMYQWLDAFLGLNDQGYPAAYQFWFIRDLMILVLVFPVGKWLVDHAPAATLAASMVIWLQQWRVGFISSEAVLFFLAGYYLVKYDLDWEKIDSMCLFDVLIGYIFCLITELMLLLNGREFIIIHKIGIILGCVFWMKISRFVVRHEKWYAGILKAAGYCFFVYAFHEPFLTMLRKVWNAVMPSEGTFWQMVQYFGLVFIAIVVSYIVGWIVNRICPWLYGWLTGGRTGKSTIRSTN